MNKIENSLGKFLANDESKEILTPEVREYLTEMFELRKQQVKIDINEYLKTLPKDKQKEALNEIYEWKII